MKVQRTPPREAVECERGSMTKGMLSFLCLFLRACARRLAACPSDSEESKQRRVPSVAERSLQSTREQNREMGDTVLSEFELERLRKIESNKERLGDLQLVQLAQSLKADAPAKKKREKRKKEVRIAYLHVAAATPSSQTLQLTCRSFSQEPTEPVERRRSSRLEAIVTGKPAEFAEPLDLPEDDDDFEASGRPPSSRPCCRHDGAANNTPPTGGALNRALSPTLRLQAQPKRQSRPRQPAGERAPAAPGSCRAMSAHVAEVRKEFLGRLMPPPDGSGAMKASVMARLRGSSTPPSHNKYSGIQVRKEKRAPCHDISGAGVAAVPPLCLSAHQLLIHGLSQRLSPTDHRPQCPPSPTCTSPLQPTNRSGRTRLPSLSTLPPPRARSTTTCSSRGGAG